MSLVDDRLLHLPARMTRGQRKRWLHLRADWPWTDDLTNTWRAVKHSRADLTTTTPPQRSWKEPRPGTRRARHDSRTPTLPTNRKP